MTQVQKLVSDGDRVIVFVQFDDLKRKVAEALLDSGVKTLQVAGTVQQQTKALDILQKETPEKGDPRVLLLTMDDESSAGVNLTTCNHAVFVHPLLADSQQQYDAYETQAIGRIRRYGQTKTVHIWRYLAKDTVDEEIYNERRQEKM
jgi:SNF2 family DNA or RNA helicase